MWWLAGTSRHLKQWQLYEYLIFRSGHAGQHSLELSTGKRSGYGTVELIAGQCPQWAGRSKTAALNDGHGLAQRLLRRDELRCHVKFYSSAILKPERFKDHAGTRYVLGGEHGDG